MKKLLLFFWACCQMSLLIGQNTSKEKPSDAFIQDLFQTQEIPINYEDFYEAMYQFYLHPIDLNTATADELQSLYILNPTKIDLLLKHRKKIGSFQSVYELQTIDSNAAMNYKKIIPFVITKQAHQHWKDLFNPNHPDASTYFLIRNSQDFQQSKGFRENNFVGNPSHLYARFRSSMPKKYSLGFTIEKDAGEKLWSTQHNTQGFDFFSWHMAIKEVGIFKNIILGDYQLQFGQGLVLGAGFNFGKGAETITTIKRNNLGARPYSSVLENGFFRGIASTIQLNPRLKSTFFFSATNNDGNEKRMVDINTNESTYEAGSILLTGLHRNSAELLKKSSIQEHAMGGNVHWSSVSKNIHLGYNSALTQFEFAINPEIEQYNKYYFRGNQNYCHSIDFSWHKHNFNIFGEMAQSSSGGKAATLGLISSLAPTVDFSMLIRHFERNYHSFYAKAFSENYLPINEQGIYWGLKIKPNRKWLLSSYFDYFKFPWLKYRIDQPSLGYETLSRITFTPSKTLTFFVQYRYISKPRNTSTNDFDYFNKVINYNQQNWVLDLQYKAHPIIQLHSRAQASKFEHTAEPNKGLYVMQEISFKHKMHALALRYAIFDTDDFDTRQYVYEKDVLYAFSIPMLYGRGSRYYVLTHFRINHSWDLWLKYIHTEYLYKDSIGTSWDSILGNQNDEIKIQVRWRFHKNISSENEI
jgi:hypothetical protein